MTTPPQPTLTVDQPLTVGLLIFDDVEVLDFAGPFEVFSVAGRLHAARGDLYRPETGDTTIKVFNIAQTDCVVHARGNLLVQPHFTFDNHPPLDLIIAPGGWGTRREVDNPVLIAWLRTVAGTARIAASVCTGAFLMGRIGLFDGRQATTHWLSLDRLEKTFPQTRVVRDVRWVDEGAVLSSAGISAGIDMSLHLVERLISREIAELTAREMEYRWQDSPVR